MIKNRILFGASVAGSIALILVYKDENVSFLLLYSLLLLFILSVASVLTAKRSITLEDELESDTLSKRESTSYRLTIWNRSLFYYPKIHCVCRDTDLASGKRREIVQPVNPRGRITLTYTVQFPYRGVYEQGVERVTVTDFLGLFTVSLPATSSLRVTVYPEADQAFILHVRNDTESATSPYNPASEDYANMADVRKYAPSDSLRKVHWKLSAKRNELMVKNYQSFTQNKTILLLDTLELPFPPNKKAAFEDKMISFITAAIGACQEKRLNAHLYYGSGSSSQVRIDPALEPEHYHRMLAEIVFSEKRSSLRWICDVIDQGADTIDLFAFVSSIDEEMAEAIVNFLSYEHKVSVFYFESPDFPLTDAGTLLLENLRTFGVQIELLRTGGVPQYER